MKNNHHILTRNRNVKYANRHRVNKPVPPTGYVPDNSLKVGVIVVGYYDNVLFVGEIVSLHRYVGTVKTRSGTSIKIGKNSKTRDIVKCESYESVDSALRSVSVTKIIN